MLKTKELFCLKKPASADPTQTTLIWFGSDFI